MSLGDAPATPDDIRRIAAREPVELAEAGLERVSSARRVIDAVLGSGEAVYGLTTRLGAGRDERVSDEEQHRFQRQVVANHSGGIGPALPEADSRALIAARLALLLNGGAGVRVEVVAALAGLLDTDAPAIPLYGSVGAADLTHLAAVLAALQQAGVRFAPGEAAALMSANAHSIGTAALLAGRLDSVAAAADHAVALSVDALAAHGAGGAADAFSAQVAAAGGGTGQARSAERIRSHLRADAPTDVVQDPLAVRTAPQLHGALLDEVSLLEDVLARALASRPENPLVDVDGGRTWSGGNFDSVAIVVRIESLRILLAHVAAASERRIALLSDTLRPFRRAGDTRLPGLTLYAASDLLAEVRQLAAPVSLGASPLSGVEDTAAFTPAALRLLRRSIDLTLQVLAIEALHASDLLRLADAPAPVALAAALELPAGDAVAAAVAALGVPVVGF
ncbi:MAG: aromatic amino acid lyase [Leifsonia sp.]